MGNRLSAEAREGRRIVASRDVLPPEVEWKILGKTRLMGLRRGGSEAQMIPTFTSSEDQAAAAPLSHVTSFETEML